VTSCQGIDQNEIASSSKNGCLRTNLFVCMPEDKHELFAYVLRARASINGALDDKKIPPPPQLKQMGSLKISSQFLTRNFQALRAKESLV
jgi:hypothetical protein